MQGCFNAEPSNKQLRTLLPLVSHSPASIQNRAIYMLKCTVRVGWGPSFNIHNAKVCYRFYLLVLFRDAVLQRLSLYICLPD